MAAELAAESRGLASPEARPAEHGMDVMDGGREMIGCGLDVLILDGHEVMECRWL